MTLLKQPKPPRKDAGGTAVESPPAPPSRDLPKPTKRIEQKSTPERTQIGRSSEGTRPEFSLGESDYPTFKGKESPLGAGTDTLNLRGETEAEDRPAIPYYRPTVRIEGRSDKDWILVRFDVEANGQFVVEMLQGTGDIHQDARILNVLRRWKWLPMRIDGQTYPSVEVRRLFRHDL